MSVKIGALPEIGANKINVSVYLISCGMKSNKLIITATIAAGIYLANIYFIKRLLVDKSKSNSKITPIIKSDKNVLALPTTPAVSMIRLGKRSFNKDKINIKSKP